MLATAGFVHDSSFVIHSLVLTLCLTLPLPLFAAAWLGVDKSAPIQADIDYNAIIDFVVNGGKGLYIAEYGHAYGENGNGWWDEVPLPDAYGNLILKRSGIAFGDDWRWNKGGIE